MAVEETINTLLEERAPWLVRRNFLVRAIRRALNSLLSYNETVRLAKGFETTPAREIMRAMADIIVPLVDVSGLENIPEKGGAMIIANHPCGIADGIVLESLINKRRQDSYVFANLDIIRVFPQMADYIAPVEWVDDRKSRAKTRDTLRFIKNALRDERIGVIFPSGRIARRKGVRLVEREWMPSAVTIARKSMLPIIPIHMRARNSWLYYVFDFLHPSLRDITLFHEMLNKRKTRYTVRIGAPILPDTLEGSAEEVTQQLYDHTIALADDDDGSTHPSARGA